MGTTRHLNTRGKPIQSYSTRLRVKRLRVGFKAFYSASARRAPRSPLRASIAHVRACS